MNIFWEKGYGVPVYVGVCSVVFIENCDSTQNSCTHNRHVRKKIEKLGANLWQRKPNH